MRVNVLLFTKNIQNAKKEIEDLGGRITQQFTDVVIVANLPNSVDPQFLKESTSTRPSSLDQISQIAVEAWDSLQDKVNRTAPSPVERLSWDTPGYSPPGYLNDEDSSSILSDADSYESTGTPTSLYMTGSVAVGLVIVSGTQNHLALSNIEQQKIIQEVQEGLAFLANAEPRARLTFVYDIRLITVTATPGPTTTKESAEAPWRNAALQAMGLTGSRAGSVKYVQKLRQEKGTNWAYVVYFTKYPLQHFAYAGDERVVMHYDNDGWGIDNINRVFAHETCHIFGAADEYGNCACGGSHGYLGVPNNNCKNCPGSHEDCLMDANTLQICQWTRQQIGWDRRLFSAFDITNRQVGDFAKWAATNNVRIITSDFNGTGRTDIALVRQEAGWATIPTALSNGDGSFNIRNSNVGDFAKWAATNNVQIITGDFNGTGRTDIALVRQEAGWATIPVAFSNGDGSFNITNRPVGDFAKWAATNGVRIITGDFNGNGRTDIALVRQEAGWATIPIALSNGDGSFNIRNSNVGDFAKWAATNNVRVITGDFNGNGRTDIALVRQEIGWATLPIAFGAA